MQIRETVKYDLKKLLQTILDARTTLRHVDNVAYPNSGGLGQMRAFQSEKNQTEFEREQREVAECQNLT